MSVLGVRRISRGGAKTDDEDLSVLAGVEIPKNLPAKVYESTDKDQMLVLKKKLECLGFRAEIIGSF